MKALITEFKGVGFRSKTEALWCAFFVNLGVRFEYEPEKQKTTKGGYVPDFYFRSLKTWVEIKGKKPTDEEITKLKDVCISTGKTGLIISGFPKSYPDGVEPHIANCLLLVITNKGESFYFSADSFYQATKNRKTLYLIQRLEREVSHIIRIGERIRVGMLKPAKAKFRPESKIMIDDIKIISVGLRELIKKISLKTN